MSDWKRTVGALTAGLGVAVLVWLLLYNAVILGWVIFG